jgi:hypothetical protein
MLRHLALALIASLALGTLSPAANVISGGKADPCNLYVVQVIGPEEMIVKADDNWIWVTGVSTAGVVDGKTYGFYDLSIQVIGTKSYTTVLGAKKTVLEARLATSEEADMASPGYAQREKAKQAKQSREQKVLDRRADEAVYLAQQEVEAPRRKMKLAKMALRDFKAAAKADEAARLKALAQKYLTQIVKEHKDSPEAKEAAKLLSSLR